MKEKSAVSIFLKLIGLEELTGPVEAFYDRLPKVFCFKKPSFDDLLEKAFYRITFALMNPQDPQHGKNILPIETDLAKYFFPSIELQGAVIELFSDGPTNINRESVFETLKSTVAKGLSEFKKFPTYRFLAILPDKATVEQEFGMKIGGIVEAFPILATQPRTKKMYLENGVQSDVIKDIIQYEKLTLARLRATALLLYGLYFDLRNLFLGDFMNKYIERMLHEGVAKMLFSKSAMDFFLLLRVPDIYSLMKKEKSIYLESKKSYIEQRLYIPLALWVYGHRIFLDSNIKEKGGGVRLIDLKTKEFLDYNGSQNYKEYVASVREKRDLSTLLHRPLQYISQKTNKPEAVTQYLEVFIQLVVDKKDSLAKQILDEPFFTLWSHAYLKGWGDELTQNITHLMDILKNQQILDILVQQNSGKLCSMLTYADFDIYLVEVAKNEFDFETLYEIFARDKALFEKVYKNYRSFDKQFLGALAKLLHTANCAIPGIDISNAIKKFITSLGNYDAGNVEAIIHVLEHFQIAQRAVSYGYTPFSGNLEELQDKLAFSTWFLANEKAVVEKVALSDAVTPYLGGSTNTHLREILIQLYARHGDEFCSKFLGTLRQYKASQTLEEGAYLKILEVLASVVHAARLCRRREVIKVLQYMALTALPEEWKVFSKKFIEINGSDLSMYNELFNEYHASAILKCIDIKGGIVQIKLLVQTYVALKAERQNFLLDQLVDILNQRDVAPTMIEALCSRIIKEHYEIVAFAINRLKQERSTADILKIIDTYQDDAHFLKAPPEGLT